MFRFPAHRNYQGQNLSPLIPLDIFAPRGYPDSMYQERELLDLQQTATEMYRIATAWQEDMAEYASLGLQELFNLLKNIPFNPDPEDTECLQRPWYTLNEAGPGGDCDDKSICTGAWAALNGIPFRFVAVSKSLYEDLHHVYTELYINGEWLTFDPTYAFNVLGRPMSVYPQRVILTPH